jgi:D-3-phosphoglycerate dehydrogenase
LDAATWCRHLIPDALLRAGLGAHALGPIARFSEPTVGLVGYGRIASRLAAMMRAVGADVVAHDPYINSSPQGGVRLVKLDQLLAAADVVSLRCPSRQPHTACSTPPGLRP